MNKDELKEFVLANPKLVSMKPAGDGIYVLKYSKRVFYDNLWNDFLEECRGTIVDADFNVVSRPFTKIYNYGIEAKAPVLSEDTIVECFRKVNGFMVAVTWHNGKLLVSTTGSTANDYVDMANSFIDRRRETFERYVSGFPDLTFMFECVHENDPHIIVEKPGLYYLGSREKTWESVARNDGWDSINEFALADHMVEWKRCTLGEVLREVKTVRHEGFVVYANDYTTSFKIKSPYYLTAKWVARNPRTDKLVNMQADIKQQLDEEYYPLVDAIRENIVEYTAMDEQARLSWVRNYLETV
jgi:hypothetical protein